MIVTQISPGNEALEFIDRRMDSAHYRGIHKSQHNRYQIERVFAILSTFRDFVGNRKMTIRVGDLSKRPENTPEEAVYAVFCDAVKAKTGIGTQDAMRKNLFVDFHRMGLLDRYDIGGRKIEPGPRAQAKFVSLTPTGHQFLDAPTILDRYFVYSKAINTLLSGTVELALEMLQVLGKSGISADEYMLFVTAVDCGFDEFTISRDQALRLIMSYRNLSRTQQAAVVDKLKAYANPNSFAGDKTFKRDFHNWRNETQQQFMLLAQTVYFETHGDRLVIKIGKGGAYENAKRLDRSLEQKREYMSRHKVDKTLGFELHHIVPLAWSESLEHFKILDDWRNMIYLDAYKHALITQNNSRNATLSFKLKDVVLDDLNDHAVELKYNLNVKYDPSQQTEMLSYNKELNIVTTGA